MGSAHYTPVSSLRLLDFRPASYTEVLMRLIGLAAVLAIGLFVAPLAAEAQHSGKVPRVGITIAESAPSRYTEALRRGLTELGWVEGQNILLEFRSSEGRPERFPALIAELISLKVDIIVAGGGAVGARAAKNATSTIPIVMPVVSDPVAVGLVSSLARPGGNATGLSMLNTEISAKRMELLRDVLPRVERVAVLRDPAADSAQADVTQAAARALGLKVHVLSVSRADEFPGAFDAARKAHAEALVVLASSFFNAHRRQLVDLAAQNRLIAVYEHREFPDAGGLMSYGPNIVEMYRRAAYFVDKILKGASPADLPVEQPTRFELVINLKTAKALGLTIPQSVLVRADEIIQ
jgi:putative tryptophan/tyrosine transport system substrate-binding protein